MNMFCEPSCFSAFVAHKKRIFETASIFYLLSVVLFLFSNSEPAFRADISRTCAAYAGAATSGFSAL